LVANTARASQYGDVVAEQLGGARQRRGEVDRPEDHHLGRRCERLDEHRHHSLARLAVRAVVARARDACGQLAQRVARNDPVEIEVAEGADRRAVGCHEHRRGCARALDHCRQRDRLVGL